MNTSPPIEDAFASILLSYHWRADHVVRFKGITNLHIIFNTILHRMPLITWRTPYKVVFSLAPWKQDIINEFCHKLIIEFVYSLGRAQWNFFTLGKVKMISLLHSLHVLQRNTQDIWFLWSFNKLTPIKAGP